MTTQNWSCSVLIVWTVIPFKHQFTTEVHPILQLFFLKLDVFVATFQNENLSNNYRIYKIYFHNNYNILQRKRRLEKRPRNQITHFSKMCTNPSNFPYNYIISYQYCLFLVCSFCYPSRKFQEKMTGKWLAH